MSRTFIPVSDSLAELLPVKLQELVGNFQELVFKKGEHTKDWSGM